MEPATVALTGQHVFHAPSFAVSNEQKLFLKCKQKNAITEMFAINGQ